MVGVLELCTAQAVLSFIEQLQKLSLEKCTKETRPYLSGMSLSQETIVLLKPYCKCWNCPQCAARNARRWIARIINGCNHMDTRNGWQMFTLTAHEKWRGEQASVINLRRGWKKLYNRMRYEYGVQNYAKVWERHKKGAFHLHGLIDSHVTKSWLKKNARSSGLGYQVDIHEVDNAGQVAGYIAKYFLKSQATITLQKPFPPNLRRIEVSRTWLKLPDLAADSDWQWIVNSTRAGQLQTCDYYQFYHENFVIIDRAKET